MLNAYITHGPALRRVVPDDDITLQDAVWIDLISPTREEELQIEQALMMAIPTREEMEEIESSSRLYSENGAHYMTATVLSNADSSAPESHAITFILKNRQLVTVRYAEPKSLRQFGARLEKSANGFGVGQEVLVGALEAIVDRIADILERVSQDVDGVSRQIFKSTNGASSEGYQEILHGLGRADDLSSRARESLISLSRLSAFWNVICRGHAPESRPEIAERLDILARDIASLSDHVTFLSGKLNFLLDTTVGLISIEQNKAMKFFTIIATAFMPPTLIAGIYGMNFKILPELEWPHGYPIALGLMLVSMVIPLVFIKYKKWM